MNPTGSTFDLYSTCRLAACLPIAKRGNAYAAEGTVFHKFFQRVVEAQGSPPLISGPGLDLAAAREVALQEAPAELRAALAMVQLDTLQLDPKAIATEVAFAFDAITGKAREIGRGLERQYGELAATEYAGTIDRAALTSDGGGYVGDYKRFGYSTPRCSENRQMKFAALCVSRAWSAKYVDAEIVRIDDDGEPWSDTARFEAFDLDSFEQELVQLRHRMETDQAAWANGDVPEATLGDHCRYCPSLPYCPAKMSLARAVIGGESDEIRKLAAAAKEGKLLVGPDAAPRIWALVKQAKAVLEAVDGALRDLARAIPFVLEDGTVVGPVPWPVREVTGGQKAADVVQELLGEEARKAAVQVKVTLDGINAGVKAWLTAHPEKNARGVIGDTEERVFAELLKRGLARKIEGVQIRAKTPKAEKKPAGKAA